MAIVGGGGSGGGGGGNDPWKGYMNQLGGFCKNSSYWATGGAACYLNYKAMQQMLRRGMVTGRPAIVFVTLFGLANYAGYRQAHAHIKSNAKNAIKHAKDFE